MNRTIPKITTALLITLGLLVITGCESARYIRSAQNHFNQAALLAVNGPGGSDISERALGLPLQPVEPEMIERALKKSVRV